jgi:hypothetical protein
MDSYLQYPENTKETDVEFKFETKDTKEFEIKLTAPLPGMLDLELSKTKAKVSTAGVAAKYKVETGPNEKKYVVYLQQVVTVYSAVENKDKGGKITLTYNPKTPLEVGYVAKYVIVVFNLKTGAKPEPMPGKQPEAGKKPSDTECDLN